MTKKYAGTCGDGSNFLRGWIRTSAGTGGDGCEVCGDGWDGTKIPSPCTPLLQNPNSSCSLVTAFVTLR